jgi:hypothetical protein
MLELIWGIFNIAAVLSEYGTNLYKPKGLDQPHELLKFL